MKKSVVIIIGMLLASVCFAQSITLGDVNENGKIEIIDALMIAQFYVGLEPEGFEELAADVNCSGVIGITDALMIAQYFVGLRSEFPCEPPTENRGLTIYFVRHAQTVANASGEMGGGGDPEDHEKLTPLGLEQIEDLTDFLIEEEIEPDFIAVSPTSRTQKTVEPYLIATGSKAEVWVSLIECCGQDPTGDPLPTERPYSWWTIDVDIVAENTFYGSEEDSYYWLPDSFEEGIFMTMTARDRLLERFSQSGKTILIVGHAVSGTKLLGLLTGYNMIDEEPRFPFYLFNTGMVKLKQDVDSDEFDVADYSVNDPIR